MIPDDGEKVWKKSQKEDRLGSIILKGNTLLLKNSVHTEGENKKGKAEI